MLRGVLLQRNSVVPANSLRSLVRFASTDFVENKTYTLFKTSSTGKMMQWDIKVVKSPTGARIDIEHGYVGGALSQSSSDINTGKNIGRSNETTPLEQALKEAQSRWKKQLDKGYKETSSTATSTKTILPMLALTFAVRQKDIVYPAIVQRKLDGIRCLAQWDGSNVKMVTRRGKDVPHMPHIRKALAGALPRHIVLDGELYSHSLPFNQITGIARKVKLTDDDEKISAQVHMNVYDCYDTNQPAMAFVDRYATAKQIVTKAADGKALSLVDNFTVNSEADIMKRCTDFVAEGYEGIMIRNQHGEYAVNQRSKHLQKFKHFHDDEFKIVGFAEATGNDAGTVIWQCETKGGAKFSVRPRGTRDERRKWLLDGKKYLGQMLTVRYQELGDNDVPRFPVGVDIRDYE